MKLNNLLDAHLRSCYNNPAPFRELSLYSKKEAREEQFRILKNLRECRKHITVLRMAMGSSSSPSSSRILIIQAYHSARAWESMLEREHWSCSRALSGRLNEYSSW